jgi:hypothetical protein
MNNKVKEMRGGSKVMKEKKRHYLLLTMFTAFLTAILFMPWPLSAGPLEPPEYAVDKNGNPIPTMWTLSDILLFTTGLAGCQDIPRRYRFFDNGDGTVTDCNTGLMWQQVTNSGNGTWNAGGNYCNDLVLGGHDDWRLPELSEMQSLACCNFSYPALCDLTGTAQHEEGKPFLYVGIGRVYWTATKSESGSQVYFFNTANCQYGFETPNGNRAFWCVRP